MSSIDSIRKAISDRRKNLSAEEVTQVGKKVLSRFLNRFDLKNLEKKNLKVGLYRPLSFELNLTPLEEIFRSQGWELHFPRVTQKDGVKMIEFVPVPHPLDSNFTWSKGQYGIQEPDFALKGSFSPDLDLIFVPGVVFGEQGQRVGMGAGYYDRFLAGQSKALRVALTFDFQILPTLEQNPWDQSVHWIFSEGREFQTAFARDWWSKVLSK